MTSFYDMMKLVENNPGSPEGNATPNPHPNMTEPNMTEPDSIWQIRQKAEQMAPNSDQALQTLWRMFRQSFQQVSPELAFAVFEQMLGQISEDFYYPSEGDWSQVGLEGVDPEFLRSYQMY